MDGDCFWFSHDFCSTSTTNKAGREKLVSRFLKFSDGQWADLFRASQECSEQAATIFRRARRRGGQQGLDKRVARAMQLVQRVVLRGTKCWEAVAFPIRVGRGAVQQEAVSQERHDVGASNSWSAHGTHLLFRAGELLCQGHVPLEVLNIILLGRLTALQKPTGGVRGIVAGEVLRRLVARTMAQQLGPAVGNFTAPFQFALTTRSGCECVAHTIQALCQADPELTLTSLDGVSAFDLISRRAMLEGLAHVPGGASALPFVHLFYGRPSRYLWEDDHGVAHAIEQGEGGGQADPLMPLLFAVGQHAGLVATHERMQGSERLFAFLDNIYTLTSHLQVAPVHAIVAEELGRHAHISINEGKTHVWNMGGVEPEGCAELQQLAEVADRNARVWRGAGGAEEQGVRVLGVPVGHPS